jgi:signal transduction histidine kinase
MRSAFITLVPMFVAAVLVTVGGERLARREMEIRTPLDRERLYEFDPKFRSELARLDQLYQSHLQQLAEWVAESKRSNAEAREAMSLVSGVLRAHVFKERGKVIVHDALMNLPKLPEVLLGEEKRPFDSNFAVFLDPEVSFSGYWRETPAQGISLSVIPLLTGETVAFLIDRNIVDELNCKHLTTWLEHPLAPLREAEERICITDPHGHQLIASGPSKHGPAAAVLPIPTSLGTWQIEAWDGVTIQKSHDTATLTATAALAAMLGISGILLYQQQRRAMRLAAERVSFVNRVSHELGSPLTNIELNLDLARDHLPDPPPAALHRLDLVAEEIRRLSRLVANVLTFSRKERNAIELHLVSCIPAEIVSNTIEGFRPALERRGIQMETLIESHQPTLLDPDALAQITGNLISNVEKYAASGGWIYVSLRHANSSLELEVRDRGPGIPMASRKRIFDAFTRVHQSVSEGSSGTGLGLAIARELAHRMNGELDLIDSNEGAAFRLRIPSQVPAPTTP